MRNLLFIGPINELADPHGGQLFKNRVLVKKFLLNIESVIIIDTFNWKCNFRTILRLVLYVFYRNFDSILISTSSISTYNLLRLIHYVRPSVLSKITYLVVGGYLPMAIEKKQFKWYYYKRLKNIIVEGFILKENILKNTELNNVKVICNFKDFPVIDYNINPSNSKVRFISLSGFVSDKGIMEIAQALKIIYKLDLDCEVDVYGNYQLENQIFISGLNYKGNLNLLENQENYYKEFSKYDCLLFPTTWRGEGFSGVIIDAFIAGLPVIASDWNMNSEIIQEGVNGFLIEPKNAKALAEKMIYVIENRSNLGEIRINNLARAKDCHIDTVLPELLNLL